MRQENSKFPGSIIIQYPERAGGVLEFGDWNFLGVLGALRILKI
jgi:hypothetical protein